MGHLSSRTKLVSIKRTFDGIEEYWGGVDSWLASVEHPDVRQMPKSRAMLEIRRHNLQNTELVERPYSYTFLKLADGWAVCDPLLGGLSYIEVDISYGKGFYIEGMNSQPQKLVINHAAGVYHEIVFQNGKILGARHEFGDDGYDSNVFSIADNCDALRFFKTVGSVREAKFVD